MRSRLLLQSSSNSSRLSIHHRASPRSSSLHKPLSTHRLQAKVLRSLRKLTLMANLYQREPMICRFDMEKEKPTQKSMILAHLKSFGSIEPLQALREYGCYALAQRIKDLRNEGHDIITETITSTSRITGRPVHFANYILRS